MIIDQQAFVYIAHSSTWMLCVVSIITWAVIGYWVRGYFNEWKTQSEESFDF